MASNPNTNYLQSPPPHHTPPSSQPPGSRMPARKATAGAGGDAEGPVAIGGAGGDIGFEGGLQSQPSASPPHSGDREVAIGGRGGRVLLPRDWRDGDLEAGDGGKATVAEVVRNSRS
ncbi:hypothetical protein BS47DRAFT_1342799 [Hydnum rufescens UP504]|uniref:Uncharacterized protein n=1 Tax=Hydnum rufescens UP504 TaxID=1448309 RepID=A0A9P6DXB2_9AGAM|nr:hypothetical protein BS47DRAFT_1342799 [Hydnum rufescens UP504]